MHAPKPWTATLGTIWADEQRNRSEALIAIRRSACRCDQEWHDTISLVEAAPDMLAKIELCSQILADVTMAINHHCSIDNLSSEEWQNWAKMIEHYRGVLEVQRCSATHRPIRSSR